MFRYYATLIGDREVYDFLNYHFVQNERQEVPVTVAGILKGGILFKIEEEFDRESSGMDIVPIEPASDDEVQEVLEMEQDEQESEKQEETVAAPETKPKATRKPKATPTQEA